MRRLRRRSNGSGRLYCATNGCPSTLLIDAGRQLAYCEICGYTRRLS
jgi:hypothetical protein